MRTNYLVATSLGMFGSMAIAYPIHAFSFISDFTSSNWLFSGDVLRSPTQASLSNATIANGDNDSTNLNFSGTNPTSAAGALQAFLGVSNISLDLGGEAQEGSAIKQTFMAAAGDILSFNLTIPNFDSDNTDLIFVLLNGNFTTFSSTLPFNSGALLAGSNTIAIGVVDIDDFIVSSQVEVSNIAFTPVPFEFSPVIGVSMLGTIFGLNYLRKKRKPKSKD